jgi:hypothetical protein
LQVADEMCYALKKYVISSSIEYTPTLSSILKLRNVRCSCGEASVTRTDNALFAAGCERRDDVREQSALPRTFTALPETQKQGSPR